MMSHDLLVQMAYLTTCFRHYDILAKTHSGMTTATGFPAKMTFSHARALLIIEKVVVLVSESKAL